MSRPVELQYVADGDPAAPVLVLGSSVGASHRMWDPQVAALAEYWRVIRFDARGHGSPPPPESVPPGPYSIADLAGDVLALLDRLEIDRFAYCGLSMGGAIGQQLALQAPDRVSRLVLCCTTAWFGGPQPWLDRAARVRAEGMEWLVAASRDRWFVPTAPVPPGGAELLAAQRDLDPEGYAACCEALGGFDLRDRLGDITVPTRVVAGAEDVATPSAMTDALADGIPGAELVVVPGAAHLANLDQPDLVLTAIRQFLARPTRTRPARNA